MTIAPQDPTFSIMTACFNAHSSLPVTIESVLRQEGVTFEYIVIDGGSTDESIAVIKSYAARLESRLRVISEPDQGVYDALNKGLRVARGRYFYFIGAGDELVSGALANMSGHLPNHERGMIYGNVIRRGKTYDGEFSRYRLCVRNISHQAIFYGRELFSLFGEYDRRYPACADWVLNLRCFGDKRVIKTYVPHTVAQFQTGGISDRGDPAFDRDRIRLVRESLGTTAAYYTAWRIFRKKVREMMGVPARK